MAPNEIHEIHQIQKYTALKKLLSTETLAYVLSLLNVIRYVSKHFYKV